MADRAGQFDLGNDEDEEEAGAAASPSLAPSVAPAAAAAVAAPAVATHNAGDDDESFSDVDNDGSGENNASIPRVSGGLTENEKIAVLKRVFYKQKTLYTKKKQELEQIQDEPSRSRAARAPAAHANALIPEQDTLDCVKLVVVLAAVCRDIHQALVRVAKFVQNIDQIQNADDKLIALTLMQTNVIGVPSDEKLPEYVSKLIDDCKIINEASNARKEDYINAISIIIRNPRVSIAAEYARQLQKWKTHMPNGQLDVIHLRRILNEDWKIDLDQVASTQKTINTIRNCVKGAWRMFTICDDMANDVRTMQGALRTNQDICNELIETTKVALGDAELSVLTPLVNQLRVLQRSDLYATKQVENVNAVMYEMTQCIKDINKSGAEIPDVGENVTKEVAARIPIMGIDPVDEDGKKEIELKVDLDVINETFPLTTKAFVEFQKKTELNRSNRKEEFEKLSANFSYNASAAIGLGLGQVSSMLMSEVLHGLIMAFDMLMNPKDFMVDDDVDSNRDKKTYVIRAHPDCKYLPPDLRLIWKDIDKTILTKLTHWESITHALTGLFSLRASNSPIDSLSALRFNVNRIVNRGIRNDFIKNILDQEGLLNGKKAASRFGSSKENSKSEDHQYSNLDGSEKIEKRVTMFMNAMTRGIWSEIAHVQNKILTTSGLTISRLELIRHQLTVSLNFLRYSFGKNGDMRTPKSSSGDTSIATLSDLIYETVLVARTHGLISFGERDVNAISSELKAIVNNHSGRNQGQFVEFVRQSLFSLATSSEANFPQQEQIEARMNRFVDVLRIASAAATPIVLHQDIPFGQAAYQMSAQGKAAVAAAAMKLAGERPDPEGAAQRAVEHIEDGIADLKVDEEEEEEEEEERKAASPFRSAFSGGNDIIGAGTRFRKADRDLSDEVNVIEPGEEYANAEDGKTVDFSKEKCVEIQMEFKTLCNMFNAHAPEGRHSEDPWELVSIDEGAAGTSAIMIAMYAIHVGKQCEPIITDRRHVVVGANAENDIDVSKFQCVVQFNEGVMGERHIVSLRQTIIQTLHDDTGVAMIELERQSAFVIPCVRLLQKMTALIREGVNRLRVIFRRFVARADVLEDMAPSSADNDRRLRDRLKVAQKIESLLSTIDIPAEIVNPQSAEEAKALIKAAFQCMYDINNNYRLLMTDIGVAAVSAAVDYIRSVRNGKFVSVTAEDCFVSDLVRDKFGWLVGSYAIVIGVSQLGLASTSAAVASVSRHGSSAAGLAHKQGMSSAIAAATRALDPFKMEQLARQRITSIGDYFNSELDVNPRYQEGVRERKRGGNVIVDYFIRSADSNKTFTERMVTTQAREWSQMSQYMTQGQSKYAF